jgi:hypothetical protein
MPTDQAARKRRSREELTITESELRAMAAPAIIGLSQPKAAIGPQCQQRSPLGLNRPPGGPTDDHAIAL